MSRSPDKPRRRANLAFCSFRPPPSGQSILRPQPSLHPFLQRSLRCFVPPPFRPSATPPLRHSAPPSLRPSVHPSFSPSVRPCAHPSGVPSLRPSAPPPVAGAPPLSPPPPSPRAVWLRRVVVQAEVPEVRFQKGTAFRPLQSASGPQKCARARIPDAHSRPVGEGSICAALPCPRPVGEGICVRQARDDVEALVSGTRARRENPPPGRPGALRREGRIVLFGIICRNPSTSMPCPVIWLAIGPNRRACLP